MKNGCNKNSLPLLHIENYRYNKKILDMEGNEATEIMSHHFHGTKKK